MTPKLIKKSDGHFYKWFYGGILTLDEAQKMQEDNQYHPSGYGFYSYKVEDGITTWLCGKSCD
jgi:hypothetical protein